MVRTKTTAFSNTRSSKKVAKSEKLDPTEMDYSRDMSYQNENGSSKKRSYLPYIFIVLLIVLGYVLFKNKDLYLAGSYNGKPVFAWDLNSRLKQRFGSQVLDEIINEKIVLDEAAKKNINVSPDEINKKVSEIEKSLGNKTAFDEALKQQGLTIEEFRNQIKLRLVVDKIVGSDVKVTEKEVDDYLTKNEDMLKTVVGSDSAKLKTYASDALKQQKISGLFEKWFTDLKNKAKIVKYL